MSTVAAHLQVTLKNSLGPPGSDTSTCTEEERDLSHVKDVPHSTTAQHQLVISLCATKLLPSICAAVLIVHQPCCSCSILLVPTTAGTEFKLQSGVRSIDSA